MYKKFFILLSIASATHAADNVKPTLDPKGPRGLTPLNMATLSQIERKEFNIPTREMSKEEYDKLSTRIAAILLAGGADPSIPDNDGYNAIKRAEKNKTVMPNMYKLINEANILANLNKSSMDE